MLASTNTPPKPQRQSWNEVVSHVAQHDEDVQQRADKHAEGQLQFDITVEVLQHAGGELGTAKLRDEQEHRKDESREGNRCAKERTQNCRGNPLVVLEPVQTVPAFVERNHGEGEQRPDDGADNGDHPQIVLPVLAKTKSPARAHPPLPRSERPAGDR
jgi:hypothetical protein